MMNSEKTLRFGIVGTGFWARFQLAGWRELKGVECVALFNRTRAKAETLAKEFGIVGVYDDVETMIQKEALDFVDIITDVETHPKFVSVAARNKVPVICQKPMAPSPEACEAMVQECAAAGVPFFIHENWRWQTPIREVKRILDSGAIGTVFRAGIDMISGFPVFVNQPFLAELDQFILTDLGSHTLDTARFLFGDASSLYCRIGRVHPNIKGEDHATIVLSMGEGNMPVVVRMAYAENFLERECFPQTLFFVEGSQGSLEVGPNYEIKVTTRDGTLKRRVAPPFCPWADPRYEVVHTSIVPCNANILADLRGGAKAETRAEDNLRSMRLVWACYESARANEVIALDSGV